MLRHRTHRTRTDDGAAGFNPYPDRAGGRGRPRGSCWRAEDTSWRRGTRGPSGRLTRPHRRSRKRADHKHNSRRGRRSGRCSKYYSGERVPARARAHRTPRPRDWKRRGCYGCNGSGEEEGRESRAEHERKKITCRAARFQARPGPRVDRARAILSLSSNLMRVIRFHIPNVD